MLPNGSKIPSFCNFVLGYVLSYATVLFLVVLFDATAGIVL